MTVWTEVLDTSFNFPSIDIFQRLEDGVLSAYVAKAQDGYVFYDTTANDTELRFDENGDFICDPETGLPIEFPIINYFTIRIFPKTYNMANFSLVAVPRDSVDENYIFGDVEDNEHEVRQKDEKSQEYAEYFAYCESCKAFVKEQKAKYGGGE